MVAAEGQSVPVSPRDATHCQRMGRLKVLHGAPGGAVTAQCSKARRFARVTRVTVAWIMRPVAHRHSQHRARFSATIQLSE
jgi:hypothetical protein